MSIPRNPMQGGSAADTAARGAASAPIRATRFTLKPSKQTAAILGAAMGAVVVACIGLYAWQTAELADIQKQVDEKRNELASGQKIASKLESVRADYEATASQLRYLETSVTESEYVPTLLHQIEALAKSVNMQVDSIRPQFDYAAKAAPAKKDGGSDDDKSKAPPAPTYDRLNIDMQMHGNYWATAMLLHRLTEFPKIMAVHSLELHPTNQPVAGASPQLGVHLTLTGFVFPVEKNGAAAGMVAGDAGSGSTSASPTGPAGSAPVAPAPGFTPAAPGSKPSPSLPPPPGRGPQPPVPARSQAPQQRAMTTHAAPAALSHGA